MAFFSDREIGELPRDKEDIGAVPWGGLRVLVKTRIEDGSFGIDYPKNCPDDRGPYGTDEISFEDALFAMVRGLPEKHWENTWDGPPKTIDILDLLDFCWKHVGHPTSRSAHSYFDHYHLSFDRELGKYYFTEEVNQIFARNGLAYKLNDSGQIERIGPPILREELATTHFQTGEEELDRILESARRKFISPRQEIRREALQELWDAWERLKTTGEGSNKQSQITSLLDDAAGSAFPRFRERLETESLELTSIGNNHQIRHAEVTQEKLENTEHIDYLFHRLFSMIQLILKTKRT